MSKDSLKKWFYQVTNHLYQVRLRLCPQSRSGFTFLTVIIVLAMLGIASGVAAIFGIQLLDVRRERQTHDALDDIKQAIIGNSRLIVNDSRADFGYVGNMGSLPTTIENLYKKGSQPAFTFSSAKKVGAGWKGPYIAPLIIENFDSLKKDAFGNDYVYSTTQYTRADGEVVVAKITSKGEDGTEGNSDDRFVEVLKREVFGTLTGTVTSPVGTAVENASVKLNIPASGVLTTLSTTTDVNGNYSFSNAPFGVYSVEVEETVSTGGGSSGISYVANSAVVIGVSNDTLQFQVRNDGANNITVTSINVAFTGASRFYQEIVWDSTVVWNYITNGGGVRGTSGETKTLSAAQTIVGTAGGTTASSTKLIRIEGSSTAVPTVILGTGAGTGGQVVIQISNFYNQLTGGSLSSIKNKTFTITFSDGSVVTFST